MREEGLQAEREPVVPQAFVFDGWSMVPLEAQSPRQSTPEAPAEAERETA